MKEIYHNIRKNIYNKLEFPDMMVLSRNYRDLILYEVIFEHIAYIWLNLSLLDTNKENNCPHTAQQLAIFYFKNEITSSEEIIYNIFKYEDYDNIIISKDELIDDTLEYIREDVFPDNKYIQTTYGFFSEMFRDIGFEKSKKVIKEIQNNSLFRLNRLLDFKEFDLKEQYEKIKKNKNKNLVKKFVINFDKKFRNLYLISNYSVPNYFDRGSFDIYPMIPLFVYGEDEDIIFEKIFLETETYFSSNNQIDYLYDINIIFFEVLTFCDIMKEEEYKYYENCAWDSNWQIIPVIRKKYFWKYFPKKMENVQKIIMNEWLYYLKFTI